MYYKSVFFCLLHEFFCTCISKKYCETITLEVPIFLTKITCLNKTGVPEQNYAYTPELLSNWLKENK